MGLKEKYNNLASSDHPATILYLVDVSRSMNARTSDGRTRIECVMDVIQTDYAQMIQRSHRQGIIRSRYRVGMIAYASDIYDIYRGFITVEKLQDMGVPQLSTQSGTNMAKAFRYAAMLIQKDIKTWSQKWLDACPAPMVVNITDCEFGKETQDPVEFAKSLQEISVTDGNVLVENIFINDLIALPSEKNKNWKGYRFDESTGDQYGDKLLAMSSAIPTTYLHIMNDQVGLKFREGTAMMFPGTRRKFVKAGFSMSLVTGSQVHRPLPEIYFEEDSLSVDPSNINIPPKLEIRPSLLNFGTVDKLNVSVQFTIENTGDSVLSGNIEAVEWLTTTPNRFSISPQDKRIITVLLKSIAPNSQLGREFRLASAVIINSNDGKEVIGAAYRLSRRISKKQRLKNEYNISIACPRILSKRFESVFLLHLYIPDYRVEVENNIQEIRSAFPDQNLSEPINRSSQIKLGERVKIQFSSEAISFKKSEVLQTLNTTINYIPFLGTPNDNCAPGNHKVLVSISNAKTNDQIESLIIGVRIVDLAFGFVSRPLLSRVSTVILGVGACAMFILTFLEQIDKTVGLTSGTAAGVLALGIYTSFYNLYQRVRPNIP